MHQIAGTHLIVDAYVADQDVLTTEHVLQTFDKLVKELRMEKLGEPVIREVQVRPELLSTDEDEGGVSIIMPITTSHIAIHTWPARRALMLDVFSCCPFNVETAFDLLNREFRFVSFSKHVVDRRDPNRTVQVERSPSYFPWLFPSPA